MSDGVLVAVMLLAYGPFLMMGLLYLLGLVLKLAGRPRFLSWIVERTRVPQPINRSQQ
jgi:hypothetical protein